MATASIGQFSGKWVFSAKGHNTTYYLTGKQYGSPGQKVFMPAMAATEAGATERCIVYQAEGGYHIQLGNGMWLALPEAPPVIALTKELHYAALFELDLEAAETELRVQTAEGFKTVYFSLDNPSPLLSTNKGPKDKFTLNNITPQLVTIKANKGCPGGDFIGCDLTGLQLTDLDLEAADFSEANATQTDFEGSNLKDSSFSGATLTDVQCTNATLDHAVFSGADLEATNWGTPASAKGMDLTNVLAAGAVLGNKAAPLNCTGTNAAGGDFQNAVLDGWNLSKAILIGTNMAGASLSKANLYKAEAQNTVFLRAQLREASLKQIRAQGANFVEADLSYTDLEQGDFSHPKGNFLFYLDGAFTELLDTNPYPRTALIDAFASHGYPLATDAPITVKEKGKRWEIDSAPEVYQLHKQDDGNIRVTVQNDGLAGAAVFIGATCLGAKAEQADFSGANLQGVQWNSSSATLAGANLENANLSNALLVNTNLSQARVSGTNFAGAILVKSNLKGCRIDVGSGKQSTSFQQALLQECNFEQATLYSTVLVSASCSVTEGTPLFVLPASAKSNLTQERLHKLSPEFEAAGNPLAADATVKAVKIWIIDNRDDPNPTAAPVYLVNAKRVVYDAESKTELFTLSEFDAELLDFGEVTPELRNVFRQNGCSILIGAPIDSFGQWQIESAAPDTFSGTVYYPIMAVKQLQGTDGLGVYGAEKVQLLSWTKQYPAGVAFNLTTLDLSQLSPDCLGPCALPSSMVDHAALDWEAFLLPLDRQASNLNLG